MAPQTAIVAVYLAFHLAITYASHRLRSSGPAAPASARAGRTPRDEDEEEERAAAASPPAPEEEGMDGSKNKVPSAPVVAEGVSPESTSTNLLVSILISIMLVSSLYFPSATRPKDASSTPSEIATAAAATLSGALAATLLLPYLVVLIARHISAYFRFKSLLRSARAKYRQTGEKVPLLLPGYRSMGSVMIAVVVALYGAVACASVVLAVLSGGLGLQTAAEGQQGQLAGVQGAGQEALKFPEGTRLI